jgi:hypothetical protein
MQSPKYILTNWKQKVQNSNYSYLCHLLGCVKKIDRFFCLRQGHFYPQSAFSTSDIYSALRRPSARRFVSLRLALVWHFLIFLLNNVARNDFQFVIHQVTKKNLHDDDVCTICRYII